MSKARADPTPPALYEIKLKGILPSEWSDWFDGMALNQDTQGNTTLSGPVIDQATLYGLLDRVRDLGMELLSITRLT